MAGLVEFAALSEDMSLIYDLRAMGNNKHSSRFEPFFKATQHYLEDKGFTSVDDRRHGEIPQLGAAIGGQGPTKGQIQMGMHPHSSQFRICMKK